jgi:hypothetical protein
MSVPSRIAISYRRSDGAVYAGLIYARLTRFFRDDDLFLDFMNITDGEVISKKITEVFGYCSVLIIVISPNWESNIKDSDDWVHKELFTALTRSLPLPPKLVFPILVNREQIPTKGDLPKELQLILDYSFSHLNFSNFRTTIDTISKKISKELYNEDGLLDRVTQYATGGVINYYEGFDAFSSIQFAGSIAPNNELCILQTWIHRFGMLAGHITKALQVGSSVRILLLETDPLYIRPNPTGYEGKNLHIVERGTNLGMGADGGIKSVEENKQELLTIYRRLKDQGNLKGNLEFRLYDTQPSLQCYICGDRGFVGLYWLGREANTSHQLEIKGEATPLFRALKTEFESRWIDATRSLNFDTEEFEELKENSDD